MVTVQPVDGSAATEQVPLPAVFSAPLRSDIVNQVLATISNHLRRIISVGSTPTVRIRGSNVRGRSVRQTPVL